MKLPNNTSQRALVSHGGDIQLNLEVRNDLHTMNHSKEKTRILQVLKGDRKIKRTFHNYSC